MKLQTGLIILILEVATSRAVAPESQLQLTFQPVAGLEPFGLEGKVVTSLGIYGSLYAGTDGEGVFYRHLYDADTGWVSLGLEGKRIRSVYPHKFGPVGFATTAGIELEPGHADSALVYCSIFNQPEWAVTDSGITRGKALAVRSLDGFPDPTICGETFAGTIGTSGQVWRRGFTSTHWKKVFDIGVGVVNVVRADQRSGSVWAGGETGIFAPWIAKSTDKGENWEIFHPDLSGDNACNSIVAHPNDPNIVYAGMEGAVIRTTDGGKTWSYTGLRNAPAYFYGLALDPFNPDHIYAGGTIANPNSWALWESFDAGARWREIPPPVLNVPVVVTGITDLVADPNTPGVIYIATYGHGVWKYQSGTTGVNDRRNRTVPEDFALEQNYPNPFWSEATSPALSGGNLETVIYYYLPSSQHVKLEVYNVLGELVATLVDEVKPAGEHGIRWNARDAVGALVPSGIYFYRLQVEAKNIATRKMMLLR